MSARLYQTDNMEVALRTLMENHRNVLVYWGYKCIKPIRLRLKVLTDLDMVLCQAWMAYAPGVVETWRTDGGCLLYRPQPVRRAVPPDTDAMLVVECPLQLAHLERLTATVRQEIVVYRPPTWQLHNETLDYLWPHSSAIVMLDAIIKALVGRPLSEELEGALALTGWPREHAAVFTAWDITQVTGWDEKYLRYIMRHKYQRVLYRWEVYSKRVRPSDDEAMAWCYDVLITQPSVSPGWHVLRSERPAQGYLSGFKTQLKRLIKGNYVVREDSIYAVNTSRPQRDYERIDAVNNMYRGRWYAVRNLVDSAMEYML